MTNPMLAELDEVVRLMGRATPGEWLTEYRKTPRGYAQEVFDAAGDTIATMAWHAVPLNETTTTTDREANAHLIAGLVNFFRTHHATLADMAKRLEAAEPDPALLASMATCLHHGFGMLDARQQQSMLHDMRKLWDEVMGRGYYRPENRERYMAYVHPAAIDATQEGEG